MTMTEAVGQLHRCDKHPDKLQYRTSEDAFTVADRRAPAEGVPIYVYACDHCGYFHLSKKLGTENIGRRMMTRRDAVIWQTHTEQQKAPERDERYLAGTRSVMEAEAAMRAALRAHGSPTSVTVRDAVAWSGLSQTRAVRTLERMGWLPEGATKARQYVHPSRVTEQAETLPAEDWRTLDLDSTATMTVGELVLTMQAMGAELQIRVKL